MHDHDCLCEDCYPDPMERADAIEAAWHGGEPTAADELDLAYDEILMDWAEVLASDDYVLEAQPNRGPRVILLNLVNGSILSSATRDNAVTS